MRIEMNKEAAETAQIGLICLTVAAIAVFVVVVWWAGLNDNKRDIRLAEQANEAASIAACSVKYGWSEYHKETYVVYEYCGEKTDG